MKNLLIIITLLAFFACKKKDPQPHEPGTSTTATGGTTGCQTTTPAQNGKYLIYGWSSKDTTVVTFERNNCPTEAENVYRIKNLKDAIRKVLKDTTFADVDFLFRWNEANKNGAVIEGPVNFTFNKGNDHGWLKVSHSSIHQGSVILMKVLP